ncbi:MAG TPA: hypothetical protein VIG99_25620 [Myxococcaceae bacterium]|jgi:hypothetical protein
MATLDVNKVAEDMLAKMKPILGQNWEKAKEYVKEESAKLALAFVKMEAQKLAGTITEQQAKILFDMQKNASLAVLAAAGGIGDLAAAQAMNAALGALKDPVNQALGFKLL